MPIRPPKLRDSKQRIKRPQAGGRTSRDMSVLIALLLALSQNLRSRRLLTMSGIKKIGINRIIYVRFSVARQSNQSKIGLNNKVSISEKIICKILFFSNSKLYPLLVAILKKEIPLKAF